MLPRLLSSPGQVASSGCNNFSFFNRRASIESGEELADYLAGSLLATRQDIAAGRLVYDPATTYITFIVGDGDNIAFMKGGRRGWMEERVSYCQSQGEYYSHSDSHNHHCYFCS